MRITGYKRSEDLDRIMEINDAVYFGEYRPPRDTVVDEMLRSDVFVAREDQNCEHATTSSDILGFAIVRYDEQPYLWNIAVDPAYQGRGIGGNLLREIIKKYTLNKSSWISLHVNVQNPAQKLYFDYGFRTRAVIKNYFKPDDGLYMIRRLP